MAMIVIAWLLFLASLNTLRRPATSDWSMIFGMLAAPLFLVAVALTILGFVRGVVP